MTAETTGAALGAHETPDGRVPCGCSATGCTCRGGRAWPLCPEHGTRRHVTTAGLEPGAVVWDPSPWDRGWKVIESTPVPSRDAGGLLIVYLVGHMPYAAAPRHVWTVTRDASTIRAARDAAGLPASS